MKGLRSQFQRKHAFRVGPYTHVIASWAGNLVDVGVTGVKLSNYSISETFGTLILYKKAR